MTAKPPQIALDRIPQPGPFGNYRNWLRWKVLRLATGEALRLPIFSAIRIEREFDAFIVHTPVGAVAIDFSYSFNSRTVAVEDILILLSTGQVSHKYAANWRRQQARELRNEGLNYSQIGALLRVSKSTVAMDLMRGVAKMDCPRYTGHGH